MAAAAAALLLHAAGGEDRLLLLSLFRHGRFLASGSLHTRPRLRWHFPSDQAAGLSFLSESFNGEQCPSGGEEGWLWGFAEVVWWRGVVKQQQLTSEAAGQRRDVRRRPPSRS